MSDVQPFQLHIYMNLFFSKIFSHLHIILHNRIFLNETIVAHENQQVVDFYLSLEDREVNYLYIY